jgi:hypothetical protein
MEACVLAGNGRKTMDTDAALEDLNQWWKLFCVVYDQAKELMESLR